MSLCLIRPDDFNTDSEHTRAYYGNDVNFYLTEQSETRFFTEHLYTQLRDIGEDIWIAGGAALEELSSNGRGYGASDIDLYVSSIDIMNKIRSVLEDEIEYYDVRGSVVTFKQRSGKNLQIIVHSEDNIYQVLDTFDSSIVRIAYNLCHDVMVKENKHDECVASGVITEWSEGRCRYQRVAKYMLRGFTPSSKLLEELGGRDFMKFVLESHSDPSTLNTSSPFIWKCVPRVIEITAPLCIFSYYQTLPIIGKKFEAGDSISTDFMQVNKLQGKNTIITRNGFGFQRYTVVGKFTIVYVNGHRTTFTEDLIQSGMLFRAVGVSISPKDKDDCLHPRILCRKLFLVKV